MCHIRKKYYKRLKSIYKIVFKNDSWGFITIIAIHLCELLSLNLGSLGPTRWELSHVISQLVMAITGWHLAVACSHQKRTRPSPPTHCQYSGHRAATANGADSGSPALHQPGAAAQIANCGQLKSHPHRQQRAVHTASGRKRVSENVR